MCADNNLDTTCYVRANLRDRQTDRQTSTVCFTAKFPLTLCGHVKTAEQYSDCTLAVDGWTVTFDTARRGLGGQRPNVPNVTKCHSPPINGQCTNFISFDVAL